jgi:riboflavin kinase
MDERILLLKLARMGAMEHYITITTAELGEEIGTSQQSASLYLKTLANRGLIEKNIRRSGTSVRISRSGVDLLFSIYQELSSIFGSVRKIEAVGTVSAGLGEGAYYLSQDGYVEQLKSIFSMDPFPGTLNLKLSKQDAPLLDLLKMGPGIEITGFRSGERTFGSCLCYPCRINGTKGVIMVPKRTLHDDTLEIISENRLRDELYLSDGDEVNLMITYPATGEDLSN